MELASNLNAAETRVKTHFDASTHLYVNKQLAVYRRSVAQRIEMLCGAGGFMKESPIQVLDVGCGAGLFLDLLLEDFPRASAHGVDLSPEMLRLNTPHDRKTLAVGDALNLQASLGDFDVICIDTVLHHLVSSVSYQDTLRQILLFMASLHRFLRPGGVLLIREIYHEYYGLRELGSRVIYGVSTMRVPSQVESFLKWAGIQTANAGVCFLSRAQWEEVFRECGFQAVCKEDHRWPGQPYRRFGFAASGDVHYLLRRVRPTI